MEPTAGIEEKKPTFEEWGIAELMGHRMAAGKLTEAYLFGRTFLRVDIPQADGSSVTQIYGAEAIYGLTVTTEDVARIVAKDFPVGMQNSRIAAYLVEDEYDPDAEPEVPDPIEAFEQVEAARDLEDMHRPRYSPMVNPNWPGMPDPPDYRPVDAQLEASDRPDLVDGPAYTGGGSA